MICKNCKSVIDDNLKFCPSCGYNLESEEAHKGVNQPVITNSNSNANFLKRCPKCGSTNISYQAVAEQKKRGCFAVGLWILLACCTCGLILLIPLLKKKGTKTRTYAICQTCGNRWKS